MKARNISKQTVLHEDIRMLNVWDEAAQGLIGKPDSSAVFIRTRWGIHTLFMRFSIDVAVLDDRNAVQALAEDVKPFHFFFWNPKWNRVLELPKGAIGRSRTAIGDIIELDD